MDGLRQNGDIERRKPRLSGAAAAAAVLFAAIVLLAAGGFIYFRVRIVSPSRTLCDLIRDTRYTEAVQYYNDHVSGRKLTEEAARSSLTEVLGEAVSLCREGTLSCEDAAGIAGCVEEMHVPGMEEDVSEVISFISVMQKSEEAYGRGQDAEAEGDLREALLAYREVNSANRLYEEAQDRISALSKQYREEILSGTDTQPLTIEDYENLLRILQEALTVLPDDQALIDRELTVRGQYSSIMKKTVLEEAERLAGEKDYAGEIRLLEENEELLGQDEEIHSLLIAAKNNYIEAVKKEAEELIRANRFEEMLSLLEEAQDVIRDDDSFAQWCETMKDSRPLPLTSAEVLSEAYYESVPEAKVYKDAHDEYYNDENLMIFRSEIREDAVPFVEIKLGGEYTELTGILAVSSESAPFSGGELILSGDGREIADLTDISYDMAARSLSADLTGVSVLRIEMHFPSAEGNAAILLKDFLFTR